MLPKVREGYFRSPARPDPVFWLMLAGAFFLGAGYYRLFPLPAGWREISGPLIRFLWAGLLVASGIILPARGKRLILIFSAVLLLLRLALPGETPAGIGETILVVLLGAVVMAFQDLLAKEREKVKISLERLEVYRENVSRQIRATMEREKQLSLIIAFSDQLSLNQDLKQIKSVAAEMIKSITKCRCVLIYSLNKSQLQFVTGNGIAGPLPDALKQIPVTDFWQEILNSHSFVQARKERLGPDWQWAEEYIIVPLSARDQVLGMMVIGFPEAVADLSQVDLLTSLGNLLGVACENARLVEDSIAGLVREREMQENLRYYLQQITRAQEEERLRIARDLHDSTAQSLIAVIRQLERFTGNRQQMTMADARSLWEIREQLKAILHEVRQFSVDLRPSILDDLGLLPAVEWLLQQMKRNYGISGNLVINGSEKRFLPEVELTLFRIIQESISNIIKHSGASAVKITMDFTDESAAIAISDNGKGFSLPASPEDLPRSGKLGLVGMQERVRLVQGKLEIQSAPGAGTTITVLLPLKQGLGAI